MSLTAVLIAINKATYRDIWTMLNKNLIQVYKPYENIVIDEWRFLFGDQARAGFEPTNP